MFGLEHITYWQFATTVALLVCFYYISVVLFLFLRGRSANRPKNFEQEEPSLNDSLPQIINARDLLTRSKDTKTIIEQPLEVRKSSERDTSGYALDEFNHPDQKQREAFIKDIHSRTQKHSQY